TFESMIPLFKIFKINAVEADKITSTPDEPHSHDFEELIIGLDGRLEHFIDFKSIELDAPLVSFVTKGKMHRVLPKSRDGKFDMWVIRFRNEFIPETVFQLYAFYHEHATLKMEVGSCFDRLAKLCHIMADEMKQENSDLGVVRHLLSALFIMIESEKNKLSIKEDGLEKTQNTTLHNFLRILEENYHRPLGVDFYAEKLFM